MIDIYGLLEDLHNKCLGIRENYKTLPERDILRVYFDLMTSQVYVSMSSLKIIHRFKEINNEEFKAMFNNEPQAIENYLYNSANNILEEVATCALFQSEMVLRFLHSALTGQPTNYGSINQITATLFHETLGNEQKDEVKLIHLFWAARNTIHSGGIFNGNPAGKVISYKGVDYQFKFNKAVTFTKDAFILSLVSDLMDSMNTLFNDPQIKNLGGIEHPSFFALGQ